MSLRSDNFDSVGELYTKDDLGELVVTIETATAFFSGLGKLEDHGERCLVGKASLGTHRAVAYRRERAFEDGGAFVPAAIRLIAAYGATIRDRGAGSTKVRAGRRVR